MTGLSLCPSAFGRRPTSHVRTERCVMQRQSLENACCSARSKKQLWILRPQPRAHTFAQSLSQSAEIMHDSITRVVNSAAHALCSVWQAHPQQQQYCCAVSTIYVKHEPYRQPGGHILEFSGNQIGFCSPLN